MSNATTCPKCNGAGWNGIAACGICDGLGLVWNKAVIT